MGLRPGSIAVIGASEKPTIGRRLIASLDRFGFSGSIFPVNPNPIVLGRQYFLRHVGNRKVFIQPLRLNQYLQSNGLREGIDDAYAAFSKSTRLRVTTVEGGVGNEAVFDRHSSPGGAKTCKRLRPPQGRLCLPRQTAQPLDAGVEPTLETGAPPPAAQQENAEAHLAEDNWIDDDFTLVVSEPRALVPIAHRREER
jgi:hypothetical protein